MCGAMISWWHKQLRKGHSASSLSSTNIPGSVWRFWLRGASLLTMLSSNYSICSYSGDPQNIFSSDNGPEFTAKIVRRWLNDLEVKTLFIEPGSPWENGYIESFNGKLRDELLGRFSPPLTKAKILIEEWRKEYNQVRPHSALNYRAPAPETIIPLTLT